VIDLCFANPEGVSPERFEEAVEEMRNRRSAAWYADALTLSLRGLVREYVTKGPATLWRQAAALQMPTLVVHGRRDKLVPLAVGVRAARVIPGARMVIAEDSGHVAQLEQPVVVAQAFLDLVEDLASTARV
jgi:pimeloyl-ACP methyl ester carboxylesterase